MKFFLIFGVFLVVFTTVSCKTAQNSDSSTKDSKSDKNVAQLERIIIRDRIHGVLIKSIDQKSRTSAYLKAGDKVTSIKSGGFLLVDIDTDSVNQTIRDFENRKKAMVDVKFVIERAIEIQRKPGENWGLSVSFNDSVKTIQIQEIDPVSRIGVAGELEVGDTIYGYGSLNEFSEALTNTDKIKLQRVRKEILMLKSQK